MSTEKIAFTEKAVEFWALRLVFTVDSLGPTRVFKIIPGFQAIFLKLGLCEGVLSIVLDLLYTSKWLYTSLLCTWELSYASHKQKTTPKFFIFLMKYSCLEKACKIVKGGVSNKTACLCQKLSSFFAFLVIFVDSKKMSLLDGLLGNSIWRYVLQFMFYQFQFCIYLF